MSSPFDPYYEWLGIPPEAQPADYYRLLGVLLYESNPNVISNAADQKMLYIRTFQNGSHSAESQKILNELAQARVTLLNAEAKEVYDAQLRTLLFSKETTSSQATPEPQPTNTVPEQVNESPWLYIVNNQQYGPVSFADIANLINARVILPTTPVCEYGQNGCFAGEHPKLVSLFQMMDMSYSSVPISTTNTDFENPSTLNEGTEPQPMSNEDSEIQPTLNTLLSKLSTSINSLLDERENKESFLKKNLFYICAIGVAVLCFLCLAGIWRLLIPIGILFLVYNRYKNSPEQLYEQANNYYNGRGIQKNRFMAAQLYKKAALLGYPEAQYALGVCYLNGTGVTQDKAEALKWIQQAAENGNEDAINYMNNC